ncbi:MAG: beta-lactamase family protein [Gammaproteobacteria bacterium]|nr:beta-lactamase family protein [Gammaproteobacteria bacterium]
MLQGHVHPDFAAVAATFGTFLRDRPGGGAACVWHRGEKMVDIWGGAADREGRPWLEDTTAPSFSTTKGVVSTLLHVLADEGRVHYDDPVGRHWPEFGQAGKEHITVRHLLTHEAGLYRIGEMVSSPQDMLDWSIMTAAVAAAKPVHTPGEQHGYHALTYGWLIGGLIEKITGEPLATTLQQRLAEPLALDGLFIGMPDEEVSRRAHLVNGMLRRPQPKEGWQTGVADAVRRALRYVGVDLAEFRAALFPFDTPFDFNSEEVVRACIPAANGQFTARSLARLYAMIAEGGALEGVRLLSPARVQLMGEVRNRTRDNVLFIPMHWRLGYHRVFAFGARAPQGFGHFGYGGSGAFCDPSRRLAVALTVNGGTGTPTGDSRMPRLAGAAIRCADRNG